MTLLRDIDPVADDALRKVGNDLEIDLRRATDRVHELERQHRAALALKLRLQRNLHEIKRAREIS